MHSLRDSRFRENRVCVYLVLSPPLPPPPPLTDFLGCCRVALKDLLQEGDSPWQKQLLLEDVQKGELELVIELTLNKSDLLL